LRPEDRPALPVHLRGGAARVPARADRGQAAREHGRGRAVRARPAVRARRAAARGPGGGRAARPRAGGDDGAPPRGRARLRTRPDRGRGGADAAPPRRGVRGGHGGRGRVRGGRGAIDPRAPLLPPRAVSAGSVADTMVCALALCACLVARETHAPRAAVLVGGAVSPAATLLECLGGPAALAGRTPGYVPHLDTMDMAERQAMTLQFLRPAQVDGEGA